MAHKIFPKELGSLIPLLKEPFCTVRFGKQNNIWDENNQDHPFHLEQNFQTFHIHRVDACPLIGDVYSTK